MIASKWQKNIAIGVMALVAVLIIVKLVTNYQANKVEWEETDREKLVTDCLEDLAGYAVRFPTPSEEYCSCTGDTIMQHFSKMEYELALTQNEETKKEEILPVILKCYNVYQDAMFEANVIKD
ncbi:hypothetical protein OAD66_05425 [Bacteroidia bacterium]|nr:hypothetical protein [Bacteroidia bacterium]MDB4106889.1 hypothetical protein [Bacteroidia bacterium]MDB9882556.1 hypothetical protein [Bacteroidia bacterium]